MGKKTIPAGEVFDFGKAYKELEDIVDWFEGGDVDLEAGLKRFERGLALARKCKERLKEVENKVNAIKVKFDDVDDSGGTGDRAAR
jgi:exodeoxyribonuclease VII small subunit